LYTLFKFGKLGFSLTIWLFTTLYSFVWLKERQWNYSFNLYISTMNFKKVKNIYFLVQMWKKKLMIFHKTNKLSRNITWVHNRTLNVIPYFQDKDSRGKTTCLFCFILMKSTELGCLRSPLVSWESSQWGGVHGLGSMAFGLALQKFLNIEWFLHWKLS
jgi:hypothetical protein